MNRERRLEIIKRRRTGKKYIHLRMEIHEALGDRDSIFFELLVYLTDVKMDDGEDRDGWIQVPDSRVQTILRSLTKAEIKYRIRSLVDKGMIRVKKMGLPAKRWVRINCTKLERILDNGGVGSRQEEKPLSRGKEKHLTGGKEKLPTTEIYPPYGGNISSEKKILRRRSSPAAGRRPREGDGELKEWEEMATKFWRIIETYCQSVNRKATPRKWAEHLRRIHATDRVPMHRIHQVMNWYMTTLKIQGDINTNGNPDYIPIAYSGETFRKKFDKLEAAMERSKRKNATPRASRITVSNKNSNGSSRQRASGPEPRALLEDFEDGF